MKVRLIIFGLFIALPFHSFSQDSIRFRDVSLAEGLKMAQAEHKPVFFMCYASWCPHCRRMKTVIFKDSAVADFYNAHFICLEQDMEKGEGIKLHEKFQVKEYPTFVFLDSAGTTLYQSLREKDDSMMIALGKTALTPAMQYPYLKQQFEKDVTNAEKCYAYIYALRIARLECSEPAKEYLATQSDQQLLSSINWKIIANGIRDINSREIQFVLTHQKEYAAIASPLRVERKLVNLAEELLSPYVNAEDSAGYFARRPQAASMHYYKVDSLVFKYDLLIYQALHNWDEYRKTADQSAAKLAWNNASQLKDIANNYVAHVSDPASLLQAVEWEKRALALNDEYAPYIVCAKLYQKAGDKKAAIEMAQKGKNFALKYGFSHFDADTLLDELQK